MAASRKRSGVIFIVLALVLIVVLVAVGGFLMRDQILGFFSPSEPAEVTVQEQTVPQENYLEAIVVAQNVARGVAITEGMLQTVTIPESAWVVGLYFNDMQEVIGKRAKYDLQAGTILTSGILTEGNVGSLASFQIPPGMVAIPVPINMLSSVAYALRPGDHVNIIASISFVDIDPNYQSVLPNLSAEVSSPDVLYIVCGEMGCIANGTELALKIDPPVPGVYQGRAELDPSYQFSNYVIPQEPQRPRMVSQTIIQDAIILGVGEFDTEAEAEAAAAVTEEDVTTSTVQPKPNVITVIVTPQDSIALDYLIKTDANLNFVLRSAGDEYTEATEAVTLQFIMDQYNIPYPAKLSYSQADRIDGITIVPSGFTWLEDGLLQYTGGPSSSD